MAWTVTTSALPYRGFKCEVVPLRISQEEVQAHIQDHQRHARSVLKQIGELNFQQRSEILKHVKDNDGELVSVGKLCRQQLPCILGDLDIDIVLWTVRAPISRPPSRPARSVRTTSRLRKASELSEATEIRARRTSSGHQSNIKRTGLARAQAVPPHSASTSFSSLPRTRTHAHSRVAPEPPSRDDFLIHPRSSWTSVSTTEERRSATFDEPLDRRGNIAGLRTDNFSGVLWRNLSNKS